MTVDDYVARLADAERDGTPIPRITDADPAFDVPTAYRVQAQRFSDRLAAGDQPFGFKLGLTSRAKQEAMGVAAPLWGRLSTGMLHEEDAPLVVSELIHPRVEPELAFLLERDVDAATASVPTVLAATAGIFPALEILDSRFERFSFALPDVIADNASAARIVLGGRLLAPDAFDCQLEGMVLRAGGEVVHTAAGAAVSGHPAAAVAWLAREAGGLPAGAIVLSGGLTAPIPLAPGLVVEASYTSLGSVSLRCT
jgi:2-oxo-3-hexenedioate decarboxylase